MLQKFRIWILLKVFNMDPNFLDSINWRVATDLDLISKILRGPVVLYKLHKGLHLAKKNQSEIFFIYGGNVCATWNLNWENSLKDLDCKIDKYQLLNLIRFKNEDDVRVVHNKFVTSLLIKVLKYKTSHVLREYQAISKQSETVKQLEIDKVYFTGKTN